MNKTQQHHILWTASLPRALIEGTLLGGLVFFVLLTNAWTMEGATYGQAMFFLSPLVTFLYSLRVRLKPARFWDTVKYEIPIVLSFTPGVILLLTGIAWLTGLWSALGTNRHEWLKVAFITAVCGATLVITRIAAYVWAWWAKLRRRRMLWALTHTYMQVVVIVAIPMFFFFVFALTVGSNFSIGSLDTWVYTIFPAVGVAVVAVAMGLAFITPVGAFVAWLTVRKTTNRVQNLANVMQVLREGDYDARVTVDGEDEIGQMQDDFNAMADELQRALANLEAERDKVTQVLASNRNLVASVSHELRTPVATIRGYLDAMDRVQPTTEDAVYRHDLQIIDNEINRLHLLIEDLFTLSQADVNKLTLNLQAVGLVAVAEERTAVFAPLSWQRERIQISAEAACEQAVARCDKARVEQILTNLLRNAIRHTPPGGIIVIRVSEMGDFIRLEVCDTGSGIMEQDLPHIWERFYRGSDAQRTDYHGAGLGLALVKDLTEAMGGSVDVKSAPGQGTCFRINLPQA